MGNWKELGEVPDSDDEGWDSDDSSQRLPLSCAQPTPQPDPQSDDVWVFHGSPSSLPTAISTLKNTQIPSTQPQSPVSTNSGTETGETIGEKQRVPPAASRLLNDSDTPKEKCGSPDSLADFPPESLADSGAGADGSLLDRRDKVSPSPVGINASTADPFPGMSPYVSDRETLVEDKTGQGNETHREVVDNAQTTTSLTPNALEASAPGRRSLRPRKPIQEHPYLLENAQYSKAFKSHGLKPIRIAAAEQMAVRRRNGDTQDPEFTGDEEQSVGIDEESQESPRRTTRSVLHDDLDELALSQSYGTSSPQRHLRASSEQSPGQQTDDTSVNEDEDFPDIGDLVASKKTSKRMKRGTISPPSTFKKRLRMKHAIPGHESPLRIQNETWDLLSSPEPVASSSTRKKLLSPMDPARRSFKLSAISHSVSPPGQLTPAARPLTLTEPIDLTALIAESEKEPELHGWEGPSSASESDLIRRTGRRIRGVLPASWLRLDQQTRKDTTKSINRKSSPPRSPNQPRPGLATKRSGLPKPRVTTKSFLDELDESDDEDTEIEQITDQAAHCVNHDQDLGGLDHCSSDDNASVVEDNFVDWMLPGQKRQRASSAGPPSKRKKLQQGGFKGPQRYRQSKLLTSVQPSDRLSNCTVNSRHLVTSGHQVKRAISPPALSIADVVEPDAPKFIKIAARAATKRNNMGRSKPLNKSINLGNRRDNVDALSILKRWRAGSIKQRTPRMAQPTTQRKPIRSREPLRPTSWNAKLPSQPSIGLSFNQPKKLSRQVSMGSLVSTAKTGICPERQSLRKARLRSDRIQPQDLSFGYRPAQLETDVLRGDDHVDFGVRKRLLDLVFRTGRKEVLAPSFQLWRSSPDAELQPEISEAVARSELFAPQLDQHEGQTTRKPSRHGKRMAPRHIDLNAPQYKHANDPLPFLGDHPSPTEEDVQPQGGKANKIIGLGPFGTHYTQHFDVFPLHGDTFFHHTTVIGNGTLNKALCYRIKPFVTGTRPSVCFHFSSYRFQWGRWTDTTSSELGLVFDFIAEHVHSNGDTRPSFGVHQVVDAAGFVLQYVLEFASNNEQPELEYFAQRMFDLLAGFLNHASHSTSAQCTSHVLLQTTSRFVLCALVLSRLCQGTAGLSNQAPKAEDILTRLAKFLIQKLLSIGLSDVRTAYDDLHRPLVRERGIRNDNFAITTWVIVMRVLSSAQIPKAGFWDLVSATMNIELTHVIDAQRLERHWRDMFTLLPLTEFDDFGILRKGARYVAPLQGWILAQKLLKVVFDSYQTNQRQSPSFNDYFRALLGRCHYLIEQWGWQRCIGVVGTIFDFFGRQNLSNLRNEEVYKSARFLEDLSSDGPCLSVEPEDRSFHIFLKILAVAIQGLQRRGLSNDIRNLVTRCLPNHNRQYSKEQTIHTHELASLRNHHDLLCTLFWAAPPESRRPVALIEDLVLPASSHKEACLINLRAWSQLARFIVSSGSSVQDYRPFMSWQNNVFHQVLNQYLSAAADVEDQFMSMAKEERGNVQKELLDSVVAANQNAAKDVLYFSVMASLDVMKHCQSLTAATFSFNVSQMAKTFNKLISKGTDLDWGILRASFDTVDIFVTRLCDVWRSLREATGDSASTHTNRELEDAVEFLDDKLSQSFIATTRKVMLSPACTTASQIACPIVEKAVVVCGRIASLFIDGGKSSLLHFFSAGKYGLFEALPGELGTVEWRFVPLFVSTLLSNHVFSFSSIGCTHFDIWVSSLIKPSHASVKRYEADLAETLKTLDMGYMAGTGTLTKTTLDYTKRRDLFAAAISYMRREVRQADFAQRRPTRAKYEKTLKSVMRQIRSAFQSLQLNSTEHSNYVQFVRDIVGLIKSHGADLCSIDPYFYQVSAEYSPPKEDPQLHTAGILAYGIRLGEGETTAIPQLFSYLYNHFKTSLSSDQLSAEITIIENGMKDDNVLAFVIGRMLPAIIQAVAHKNDIWPLLDVYAKALYNSLTRSCLPREVPEDAVDGAVALLTTVLTWAQELRESSTELTPTQAHIFTQLLKICNAIRPSLACWLLQSSATTSMLQGCVVEFARVAKQAAAVLGKLHESGGSGVGVRNVPVKDLILAKIQLAPITFDNHIRSFKQSLVRDVLNNWVITSDHVTVRVAATPSAQRGTQAVEGVKNDLHTRVGLLSELLLELQVWVSEAGEGEDRRGPRRKRKKPRGNPTELGFKMKITNATILTLFSSSVVIAHPEHMTAEVTREEAKLAGRSTNKCAAAIEKRKANIMENRAQSLYRRRVESGHIRPDERSMTSPVKRNTLQYQEIQNNTCVLAPDTIWGPYGIDGEIVRHDLRENETGIDFYFDVGVIDVETCEPLPKVALTIWNCNATGSYSGYTGVDPDTVELLDGWTSRDDGTTDDETFLRGVQITNDDGMAEFLTVFPGYYVTRATHIHITAQAGAGPNESYSNTDIQHIGQLFFDESLLEEIYDLSPYSAHKATLNRTLNSEDSIYSVANADGYSALVDVSLLGETISDGLVGYITIGINSSAAGLATTGTDVNPNGFIPTVSVSPEKVAQATAIDLADGYTERK
ncbi:hypothetical protein N0V82_009128 [Gnomoniopsis sp. IMI 355080]|nr:hypothetical protein N0V82_009128 [Gnomoniopsis sp. IMI 355080]